MSNEPTAALVAAMEHHELDDGAIEHLRAGADVRARARDGGSLLHHAVAADPLLMDVLREALDLGAEVNATDDFGVTPLALARRLASELEQVALDEPENDPLSRLGFLLAERHLNRRRHDLGVAIGMLEARGGRVVVDRGSALADAACRHDNTAFTALCREAGEEELAVGLRCAVRSNDSELVQTCISNGADPSATGSDGTTPLMLAASEGHLAVARMLLEAGADLSAIGPDGTAADCAAIWNRVEVLAELRGVNATRGSFTAMHMGMARLVAPVLMLIRSNVDATSRAISKVIDGCRIEKNMWGRQIVPSDECYFLLRPRKTPWTLCYPAQLLRQPSIDRTVATSMHAALAAEVLLVTRATAGAELSRLESGSERMIAGVPIGNYLRDERACIPPWPVVWPTGDLSRHPLFCFNPQEFEPVALAHVPTRGGTA